jgi:DNA helicase IV
MTTNAADRPAQAEILRLEQQYFERAWQAREQARRTLAAAAGAAAGGKAASAVGKAAREHADELGAPDEPVAIGRFDLDDGDPLYVGKHFLRDDDGEPLVISWKAPAAARFFTASWDDPQGLRLRRTFELEGNRVLSFEDLVFADLVSRVGTLTALEQQGIDDNVLRELEAGRTGEMRDIVQTIHAAQYELVRSPLDQLLVVQGGPGTGKTVVALHRVSWLLFNHRDELQASDVLVVGPNPTFTRYIRSVLPGLGDADVTHHDLRALGPQRSTGRLEDPDVVRLKGDGRMARLLVRALAQRIRFPDRAERLEVGSPQAPFAVLEKGEVEAAMRQHLTGASSYMAGRNGMRSWLTNTVADRARWGVTVPPPAIEQALERVWPSLSAQAFLRDLLGSRDRLLAAAGEADFSAAEVRLLSRPSAERVSVEQWSDADVALLDEAEILLNGPPRKYRHIVVDEAQDLTPMQLRSVRRRSRAGSYTLVGDLAQSTGPWARESWTDVTAALRDQCPEVVSELTLGYRVPKQVFELAAQLLPHAAPAVTVPQVIRRGPEDPELREVDVDDVPSVAVQAARDHAARGLFVGVVCPDRHRAAVVSALEAAGVQFKDARSGSLGTSINLVDPHEAKGLEFEAVVVVEPESIASEHDEGLRLLYVALTRTTKYLAVVHSGQVLPLPGSDRPTDRPPVEITSLEELDGSAAHDLAPEPQPAGVPAAAPTGRDLGSDVAATDDPLDHLSLELAAAMAERLADHVVAAAQPALWSAVVERLALELERRQRS